jgi:hypothetical protein
MNKIVTIICFLCFATIPKLFADEASNIANIKNAIIGSCMSVKSVEVLLNPQQSNPAQYDVKIITADDKVLLCKAYLNSSKEVDIERCQLDTILPYMLDGVFSALLKLTMLPSCSI